MLCLLVDDVIHMLNLKIQLDLHNLYSCVHCYLHFKTILDMVLHIESCVITKIFATPVWMEIFDNNIS